MRVIQITDTHFSHTGGTTNENAEKAIELINELAPDLVVHTGDVTILDPDLDADRVTAKEALARIEAPLRVLPGNHDVGEPGPKPFGGKPVTSDRVSAFRAHFGIDRFVESVGDWNVIGVNSEVFSSGLPEEEEQWEWIESLPGQLDDRPAIFFSHKPIWAYSPEFQTPNIAFDAAALPRLEAVLAKLDVRAFGSGHLHHFALTRRGDAAVVSAPPTAFLQGEMKHEEVTGPGIDQIGIIAYEIEGGRVQPFFRSRIDFVEESLMQIDSIRTAAAAMGIEFAG